MTLVMTHQCNFDCKYCLQKHEDVAMPEETALKAIDIFVNGVKADIEAQKKASEENPSVTAQISFYGGEPLLQREKIEKLVGYSSAALQAIPGVNFAYEITTNGTLLDEEFIAFAKKNSIILALSHDGLSQDPVRRDRGGHPTKDTVDGKLQMLLKATPGTIIMMTVHPDYADRVSGSSTIRAFARSAWYWRMAKESCGTKRSSRFLRRNSRKWKSSMSSGTAVITCSVLSLSTTRSETISSTKIRTVSPAISDATRRWSIPMEDTIRAATLSEETDSTTDPLMRA